MQNEHISEVISLARKTASKKGGRTKNDKCSLVESIAMGTLQPRGIQTEERKKSPTPTSIAKVLRLRLKYIQSKRAALEAGDTNAVYS